MKGFYDEKDKMQNNKFYLAVLKELFGREFETVRLEDELELMVLNDIASNGYASTKWGNFGFGDVDRMADFHREWQSDIWLVLRDEASHQGSDLTELITSLNAEPKTWKLNWFENMIVVAAITLAALNIMNAPCQSLKGE